MKVFILAEGSKSIGFGHITRCTALYQAFEAHGAAPEFIVNGDETVQLLLDGINHKIWNWIEKQAEILKHVNGADIVVIDSYLAGYEFYKTLSTLVKQPIYLDDNRRLDYPRGVVVNGAVCAEEINYPQRAGVVYLLGSKYAPLRKEFWSVPEKEIRDEIKNVLITFGGCDSANLTPKILELMTREFHDLSKEVLVGRGFQNVEEIERLKDERTHLRYNPEPRIIKEIMIDSDIAFSAAGQTLYELARIGVPTIALAVADNQLNNVEGWRKAGFIESVDLSDGRDLIANLTRTIGLLSSGLVRKEKSLRGRKAIDGNGARRIANEIVSMV